MSKKGKCDDVLWAKALHQLDEADQTILKTHGMPMARAVVNKHSKGSTIEELTAEYEVEDVVIHELLRVTPLYEAELVPLQESDLRLSVADYKDPIYQRGWTVSCGSIPSSRPVGGAPKSG